MAVLRQALGSAVRGAVRRVLGRPPIDRQAALQRETLEIAREAFRRRDYGALCERLARSDGDHPVRVAVERNASHGDPHVVAWTLGAAGSQFLFDAEIFTHPSFDILVERWVRTVPMLSRVGRRIPGRSGSVLVNLGDYGSQSGLAFCDFRPDFTLVPDSQFLASRGYAQQKSVYVETSFPWAERRSQAIWRGQTSGWHDTAGREITTWRDLPRVALCELARSPSNVAALDARLTGIAQVEDGAAVEAIQQSGLLGPSMPWRDFQRYKYQVDIDGNTNAWEGLFIKLCSGSCVLKVQSSLGFRQWYYDRLVPWFNVVPVEADMSDLMDKIGWLMSHDDEARVIGANGQQLALAMSCENELVLADRRISSALQGSA